jgi:serine/threonine protein kinase
MASQVLKGQEGDRFSSRYEVQQQLGKRAGRRTLLARDLQTQELVVIKLLSFGNDFEWDDLKLFEREAETLKSLNYAAIPRYLDYFEVDSPEHKGFALVQTYIDAKSLEEQLRAGRSFSETEVMQLAKDLLKILNYLHERQPPVIHRDIKPSNILLTNRSGNSVGQVYLVDFGSVQTLAAREGGTITVVGTYGYMPPEQFGGRAVPASDLYSLGATLIYLVTGKHPADLPQKDLCIQFEQESPLSPTFKNWIKQLIEPSLDRRFSSATEALKAIEKPHLFLPIISVASTLQSSSPPDSSYPTVTSQPVGSKIRLRKDSKGLEILLPPQGGSLSVFGWTLFALPWNYITLMFLDNLKFYDISLWAILWLILLGGIAINITLKKILFPLFGRVRIRLNQQQMTLAYELLGFKYQPRPIPSSHICKLVHTKRYYRMAKSLELAPRSNYILDHPRLIVWAGTKKHQLCSGEALTDPELDWIGYELSNWLNFPIVRE